ncbi:phosphoribosylglycinamide formyltransferase 2 [Mycolicibacterium madagascariense]|uniref:Phosphoribosylglycinamide formyltransferase 2 n=1 Tax=Mycolicibacterium madagascariense TaxID=212765 RepID=A0A7I7XC01_9MYCO|nr:ATP-grasp domain-containing protein [Mycolicibacterium madagascariense]MCV7015010.1 ATP-grasp domain-containing protein [Mycolicibacterium madagascariense]BBZ26437.1 phosphoribosylglycinamide formyltransferase 2 [Mycolicibacterium madagascariense]
MTESRTEQPSLQVLLLGEGDGAPELASAFERLGVRVTRVPQIPDAAEIGALLDEHRPDYLVAASADVPAAVLLAADERGGVEVFPTPRAATLTADREGLRKLAGDELGLPTVPFWFASSADELAAVAGHAGFPLLVTPLAGSVPGGQSVLTRPEDVAPAWTRAVEAGVSPSKHARPEDSRPPRVMAETVVDVDDEVTLLTVRTAEPSGPPVVQFCEPIGHRRAGAKRPGESDARAGAPLETWQPHRLEPAALDAARSIAARIVGSLGGRGVFAVELLVCGDEVYFATVTPQPAESGLITLRSQRLSQFELHARAILGLAFDTILISPAAAEVGSRRDVGATALAEALTVPESDLRVLDATSVALATAPDVVRARDRAHRVSTVVHGLGS